MKLLNPKYLVATLAIFLSLTIQKVKAQVKIQDSLTLVDLYDSTGGPNWINHTNWLTTAPVSTWFGVGVTAGRVDSLKIEYNQLTGLMPQTFAKLSNLKYISLLGNQLKDSILPLITSFNNLNYLEISSNQFNDTIPASIGNLSQLTYLGIDNNQFAGTIPLSLYNLTKLTYLGLSNNKLSGIISSSIGNLINLTYIDASENALSGIIPSSFGKLNKITGLNLSLNQLTDTIPASLGNLTALNILYLFNNQLCGSIPPSIGNLTKLTQLVLANNKLSGSIPSSIKNLTNLNDLGLDNNQFTFDGMELIATKFPFAQYAPQAPIPLEHYTLLGGGATVLNVTVGGTKEVYNWYNSTGLVATNYRNSYFEPSVVDYYYVHVTDSLVPGLTLQSDTVNVQTTVPIKAINLQAVANNGQVLLQWQTINEINTVSFIIQHSADGSSFTDIGTIKAIGKGDNSYSLIDKYPASGINYYRIKSIDKDGLFTYSKVVSVQLTVNSNQLTVFPNPAKDKITVRGNHIVSIQVLDNLGRAIKTQILKDATNPTLSVSTLPVGVYHLRVQTTDGKVSGVGFVKE